MWVAVNGSDTDDGSASQPFQTLSRALSASSQLLVTILSGYYPSINNSELVLPSGSFVVLQAAISGTVVIDLQLEAAFLSTQPSATLYMIGMAVINAKVDLFKDAKAGSIFTLSGSTVFLLECTFSGCDAPALRAISSDCWISDCRFSHNNLPSPAIISSPFIAAESGAMGSIFSVINSSFSHSAVTLGSGQYQSGAVLIAGYQRVNVSDSVFASNSVTCAAATTEAAGAALSIFQSGSVFIRACTFSDNLIENPTDGLPLLAGAGLVLSEVSQANLTDCVFTGNRIEGSISFASGAALNVSATLLLSVSDCLFSNNAITFTPPSSAWSRVAGAAVAIFNGSTTFSRATFDSNSFQLVAPASQEPSRVFLQGGIVSQVSPSLSPAAVVVNDSIFQHNTIDLSSSHPASSLLVYGGVLGAETLDLTSTLFDNNTLFFAPRFVGDRVVSVFGWQVFAVTLAPGLSWVIFSRGAISGTLSNLFGLVFVDFGTPPITDCAIVDMSITIQIAPRGSNSTNENDGAFFCTVGYPSSPLQLTRVRFANLHLSLNRVSSLIYNVNIIEISNSTFENLQLTFLDTVSTRPNQLIFSEAGLQIESSSFSNISIDSIALSKASINLIAVSSGAVVLRNVVFQDIQVSPSSSGPASGLILSHLPGPDPFLGFSLVNISMAGILVSCAPVVDGTLPVLMGLIYSARASRHTISACSFDQIVYRGECTAKGGVIHFEGGDSTTLVVNSTTFADVRLVNSVPYVLISTDQILNGAALYLLHVSLTIDSCTFVRNSILSQFAAGAAIYARAASQITIQSSSFDSCSLQQQVSLDPLGGVVAIQSEFNIPTQVVVDNCSFTSLEASQGIGGAILGFCRSPRADFPCTQSAFVITRSLFEYCRAINGGAVALLHADLYINYTSFLRNSARSNTLSYCSQLHSAGRGVGGALYLLSGSVELGAGTSFAHNTASSMAGGAYIANPSTLWINGTGWEGNLAPGMASGLLISTDELTLRSALISASQFRNHKGAGTIGLAGASMTASLVSIVGCAFSNNTGTQSFQGIVAISASSASTLLNCSSVSNPATPNGMNFRAIISTNALQVNLINCSSTGNSEIAYAATWTYSSQTFAGQSALFTASPMSICSGSCDVEFGNASDLSVAAYAMDGGASFLSSDNWTALGSSRQLTLTPDEGGLWQVGFSYLASPSSCSSDQQSVVLSVLPGCASSLQSYIVNTTMGLLIPCASSIGSFFIVAIDAYGNQLTSQAHSCANISATLTNPDWPAVHAVVVWDDQTELFKASFLGQHGGIYQLSVTIQGQQLGGSPQTVLFSQPSAAQSTLICLPGNGTSFSPSSLVQCRIFYRDINGTLLSFCPGSLPCTFVNVSGGKNISVSELACSDQTTAVFDWELGGDGDYSVSAFILGAPLTPFEIVLTAPQVHKSWWDSYGWYAVGALTLIVLLVAGLAFWYFRRRMVQHQRLTQRYELIGVDFMNVPDSGKMFLSLLTLLEDASIKKVKWQEIEPFFGNSRLGSSASSSVEVMGEEEGEGMAWSAENLLGQGAAGTVWKAKWNGQALAVKQIHMLGHADQDVADFFHEIKTLASLDHPNMCYLQNVWLVLTPDIVGFLESVRIRALVSMNISGSSWSVGFRVIGPNDKCVEEEC